MNSLPSNEDAVAKFATSTLSAAALLFEKQYYGQFLVVVYSAIDTLGLLNAAPNATRATGRTFRSWAETHLIHRLDEDITAIELWGARCGVLHTFGTASDVSISGEAREIQYYAGDIDNPALADFVSKTNLVKNGANVALNMAKFGHAFSEAVFENAEELVAYCDREPLARTRLMNVIQLFPSGTAP